MVDHKLERHAVHKPARPPDQLKTRDPIIAAGDGLDVDDAGSGAQPP
jgi:hypothetical protein